MMRFVFPFVCVTVAGGLVLFIDSRSHNPVEQQVLVADADQYMIFAPGRIEGNRSQVELRPQLAGQVMKILVAESEVVETGQLLLQLDDVEYRHEVMLASAEVELAEAQLQRLKNGAHQEERLEAQSLYNAKLAELEKAHLDWRRAERLRDESVITEQEMDDHHRRVKTCRAEADAAKARVDLLNAPPRGDELQMAQARVQSAQARLELAKVQLARAAVHAPSAGKILEINVEPGELTGPNAAVPVLILADTSRYRVRAFVEELDAPRVQVGMSATVVADGLAGTILHGRVIQISPRMTSKEIWSDDPTERHDTKTREVWIELDSDADLVLGLRMDVTIDPARCEQEEE